MHQVKKWTKIMANPMFISITNATRIELGLCGRVRSVTKEMPSKIYGKVKPSEGFKHFNKPAKLEFLNT